MLEIFKSGGPLMYVILLLAILGLAVVLDRLFYLIIKESKDMESMKEEIIKLVKIKVKRDSSSYFTSKLVILNTI